MEQLIPLIIMLLIGSFFSSKKKKAPEKGKSKPFTAQETQSGTMGKLKEMYEELQREMQPEAREREIQQTRQMSAPSQPVVPIHEPIEVVKPKQQVKRTGVSKPKERSPRRATASNQSSKIQNPVSSKNIMPKNKDDLIKGVIFSEIFGPPISKR